MRIAVIIALVLSVVILSVIANGLLTHSQPNVTCQEDMPCWDCTTMGNRICGNKS